RAPAGSLPLGTGCPKLARYAVSIIPSATAQKRAPAGLRSRPLAARIRSVAGRHNVRRLGTLLNLANSATCGVRRAGVMAPEQRSVQHDLQALSREAGGDHRVREREREDDARQGTRSSP